MGITHQEILLNRKMPRTTSVTSKPLIPVMSAFTGAGQSSLIEYLLDGKLESPDDGNIQTLSPTVCSKTNAPFYYCDYPSERCVEGLHTDHSSQERKIIEGINFLGMKNIINAATRIPAFILVGTYPNFLPGRSQLNRGILRSLSQIQKFFNDTTVLDSALFVVTKCEDLVLYNKSSNGHEIVKKNFLADLRCYSQAYPDDIKSLLDKITPENIVISDLHTERCKNEIESWINRRLDNNLISNFTFSQHSDPDFISFIVSAVKEGIVKLTENSFDTGSEDFKALKLIKEILPHLENLVEHKESFDSFTNLMNKKEGRLKGLLLFSSGPIIKENEIPQSEEIHRYRRRNSI